MACRTFLARHNPWVPLFWSLLLFVSSVSHAYWQFQCPSFGNFGMIRGNVPHCLWNQPPPRQTRSSEEDEPEDQVDHHHPISLESYECETDPVLKNQARMNIVRSLQSSFYQSNPMYDNDMRMDDSASMEFDADATTGTILSGVNDSSTRQGSNILNDDNDAAAAAEEEEDDPLQNLPLWCVAWTELPGRTNALSVHDPMYTNMFETLLRRRPKYDPTGDDCVYFGHFCSTTLDDSAEPLPGSTGPDSLGTLMRVTDFRRMEGGTLLLLVQAIERILVTNVVRKRPYGVANVRLWPDDDEHDTANAHSAWDWFAYEYDKQQFPLPLVKYMTTATVSGAALRSVLPLATFHRHRSPPTMLSTGNQTSSSSDKVLQSRLVTKVSIPDALRNLSSSELEIQLWIALDKCAVNSRTTISPILLGLLPVDLPWLDGFACLSGELQQQLTGSSNMSDQVIRVSPLYPACRRQKRLSYTAAQFLERASAIAADPDRLNVFRRQLLQIPSTQHRLAFLIGEFETEFGSFQ